MAAVSAAASRGYTSLKLLAHLVWRTVCSIGCYFYLLS
jgi:hypothetical protein